VRSHLDRRILEGALQLLIIDIAVMLVLAGAMLTAARIYLGDRPVLKHLGQAILRTRSAGDADE
jgi:hypothetical protein